MLSSYIKGLYMKLGDKRLDLSRPQIMAIVNVTNDSFFDGGRFTGEDAIAARVSQVVEEGAAIVDIGGYSSRPNATDVSIEEEWLRVKSGLSVVRRLAEGVAVSIDTFRAEVARRAVEEFGEVIINDISAGEIDPDIIDVAAKYRLPYVAMHMRGTPQTMLSMTDYPRGVTEEGCDYFQERVAYLRERGVEQIVLDPGFGFAKTTEQNYELLAGLNRLCDLGYPVLAGLSRKSMIYKVLDVTPAEALNGTTALNWEALRQGATILRVHDVREAAETVKLFEAYNKRVLH